MVIGGVCDVELVGFAPVLPHPWIALCREIAASSGDHSGQRDQAIDKTLLQLEKGGNDPEVVFQNVARVLSYASVRYPSSLPSSSSLLLFYLMSLTRSLSSWADLISSG